MLHMATVFSNEQELTIEQELVIAQALNEMDLMLPVENINDNVLLRSISSTPPSDATVTTKATNYTQSAFVPRSGPSGNIFMFVASDKINEITTPTPVQAAEVLARLEVGSNGTALVHLPKFPLAPAQTKLNGTADTPNPLNGATIENLTLFPGVMPVSGAIPAVSVGVDTFLVTRSDSGSEVLKNGSEIKDAGNNSLNNATNKQIYALAASSSEIFAAVAQTDKTFKDSVAKDRGIAVLRKDAAALNVLNAGKSATASETPAAKIDLTVYDTSGVDADKVRFAFAEAGGKADPTIDDTAALFWDQKLSRLYIGLSGVDRAEKGGMDGESGALTLAVAYLDKAAPAATTNDVLNIQPIVPSPKKALFYDASNKNVNDRIVGFYFDKDNNGDNLLPLSVKKIRMMHTSTGRDYLIVNGQKATAPGFPGKGVYALPVLGLKKSDGTDRDPKLVGTIAKVDAVTGVSVFDDASPTLVAQMPQDEQAAVLVGGKPLFKADVSELFVEGDSIFLFLAGGASNEVGIFQSTALFDSQGNINGWTPWQRGMGSMERAFGGGYDPYIGSFFFLTEQNKFNAVTTPAVNTANIVKVTSWGKTSSISNLSEKLESLFAFDRGGVLQMFSFDEMTPGFRLSKFSMMIALGLDRVALVQTGKDVGADQFIPETDFQAAGSTVPFENQVIKDLGPLCAADVSRSAAVGEGWVFVGGYNGIAVLSKADGSGYKNLQNLSTDLVDFSFKKLTPSNGSALDHVRKILCDDKNLYVMTRDKIFKIVTRDSDGKFKEVSPDPLDETVFFPGETGRFFSDCVVVKGKAIVATNKGLFVTDGATSAEVKISGKSLGPVVQLQYLSNTKGKASDLGNLYVMTGDLSKNPSEGKIYRFAVNGANAVASVVQPIKDGLFMDLQEFRGNFTVDGASILTARGKHFDDENYLKVSSVSNRSWISPLASMLDIDFDKNFYVAAPLRESASGAWMLPGDWGTRANL